MFLLKLISDKKIKINSVYNVYIFYTDINSVGEMINDKKSKE